MKTKLFSAISTIAVLITLITAVNCHKIFYKNHLWLNAILCPLADDKEDDSTQYLLVNNFDSAEPRNEPDGPSAKTISPPLPGMDPISKNIYLHTNKGVTYVTENKTRIDVPPFAFTDRDGNIIDAEVEIQYREFIHPFDIFLSGIPMQFDMENTLATTRLFEINASSFGKPVFINPENPVTFSLPFDSINNKLFHFDQTNRKWIANPEEESMAESQIDSLLTTPSNIPLNYAVALKCKTKMSSKREHWFGRKHAPDHFIFSIMNFTDLFPELNELKKINWICDGTDALENYYKLFAPGQEDVFAESIIYCDSITIENNNERYVFVLKKKERIIEIPVRPYIININDELNFQLAFSSYAKHSNQEVRNTLNTCDAAAKKTLYSFSINKLGVWNYGKITPDKFQITAQAKFHDEAGRQIKVNKAWMAVRNINAIFEIRDFKNFSFRPTCNSFLWTLLEGDRIGIVGHEEFCSRNIINGEVSFTIRIYESPSQLKNKLRIVS